MKRKPSLATIVIIGMLATGCIKRSEKESRTPTTPNSGNRATKEAKALASALDPKKLVLTTASGSRKRILALGLSLKGSEDVSAMLVRPNRPFAKRSAPQEAIEWSI
ncbi:MAG: hypothetical protein JRH20_31235, partial [Deltaproteobacteria bacterium]|nr:hypothetical protein [Deltaproteobacteria bacterium]